MGELLVVWSKEDEEKVKRIFFQTVSAGAGERTAIRSIVTDVTPISKEIKVEPLKILAILKWVQGP